MNLIPWLAACWMAATVCAAMAQTHIVALRSWVAPAGADTYQQARAALDAMPPVPVPRGTVPELRLGHGQATWIAVDLPALPIPAVLEITYPFMRNVDLYLPDPGGSPVQVAGFDVPAEARLDSRFPGTVTLPRAAEPRTAYLRVQSPLAMRGHLLLQPRHSWELVSRLELAAITLGFGITGLAVVYTLARAIALRSTAYLLYSLLAGCIAAAGLLLTGLGEATVWHALVPLRPRMAELLACFGAGLALLLADRAFALEISAPRFGMALRVVGVASFLVGIAAWWLPLATQQLVSQLAVAGAIALGLVSVWLAWRTSNNVAAWLLAGYAPVVTGVAITTLAGAGALAYAPWVLLALPLGGMLEIPFNLRGLRLLEERRAQVRGSLRALEVVAGYDGETRDELKERLALPPEVARQHDAGCTLMLLRFEGLEPGSATVRALDRVAVENYMHAIMAATLRPGCQVGRWSHHELLLRDLRHGNERETQGLITSLFAQSLRGDRFGIPPQEPALRIAHMEVLAQTVPVFQLARQLGKALEEHPTAKRVEVEAWED